MSALTRIFNNQIYNATIIASQKIAPGTITGSLFSSNVTVPGDLLIAGNLFVLGSSTYTVIASTNTFVNDPLLTLNNGFAGTNTYDEGLIFNRGTSQNQAFVWSEFNKEFRLIGTTETGTTYGNVVASNFASLHVGNIGVDYAVRAGSLAVNTSITSASLNSTGNILATGGVFNALTVNGNETVTGFLNVTGNVMSTGAIHNSLTVNGNGTVTGFLNVTGNIIATTADLGGIEVAGIVYANSTVISTTSASGAVRIAGGTGIAGNLNIGTVGAVSGQYHTVIGNITQTSSGGAVYFNTTGNVSAAVGAFGAIDSTGYINTSGNISTPQLNAGQVNTTGNVLATAGTFDALTVNGNETVTGFLNVTGNVLASTVRAAQLNTSGNVLATAGTFDALTVNGNETVTGFLNVTGNILGSAATFTTINASGITAITDTTNATETTGSSGALQVKGGVSIAKDAYIGGNLYVSNIFGASHQILTIQDPLVYFDAANTFPYGYDIGFYSNFVGPSPVTGTGNIYQHTGVVRDNLDNTWKFFSNVQTTPGGSTVTFDTNTIYDPVLAGNLQLTYTQAATSTTTGALQVAGGAGIAGAVVAGQINSTSNVLGQSATFNALQVNGNGSFTGFLNVTGNVLGGLAQFSVINATPIGNITPSTGVFTTLTAGQVSSGFIGNTGTAFTGASLNLSGNVLASTIRGSFLTASTVAVGNISAVTIGNAGATVTGTDGTFGAVTSGFIGNTGTAFTGASLNVTGNVLAASITSTTIQVNGNVNGGLAEFAALNATPVGNATPDTGSFTTLRASQGIWANSTTASTTTTTGAIVVAGGIGLAGNIRAGGGAVFNSSQTADPFQVRGVATTSLIYADTAYGAVVIGGSNTATPLGSTLKVNGTDSMLLPTGTSAQRPGLTGNVDLPGMMRFNTTINSMEVYDGTQWITPGGVFTVISSRQFSGNVAGGYGNVDGVNTTFTLQNNATTAGALVSINGVLQIPTLAYAISGTTLTFTEPPSTEDIIDVRILTTSVTVSALTNGSGLQQFIAGDTGLEFWTGVGASFKQAQFNQVGDFELLRGNKSTYTQTPVNIVANNTPYVISTWNQTAYTTAKYVISAKRGATNFQSMEALVTTDQAGNAYIATYAVVDNGTEMGSLSANVVGGNVQVYWTTTTNITNANVKAMGTYIV